MPSELCFQGALTLGRWLSREEAEAWRGQSSARVRAAGSGGCPGQPQPALSAGRAAPGLHPGSTAVPTPGLWGLTPGACPRPAHLSPRPRAARPGPPRSAPPPAAGHGAQAGARGGQEGSRCALTLPATGAATSSSSSSGSTCGGLGAAPARMVPPAPRPRASRPRGLSGPRAPGAARGGESGREAALARRPGSARCPSLPTPAFDCGSKGGKKWRRSRPRPPRPSTHQALSLRPGRRARERGTAAPAGQGASTQGPGRRGDAPEVRAPGGAGVRVGAGSVGARDGRRPGSGGSGQRPCPD